MKKIRTFKKFTLVYSLEKTAQGFYVTISKDDRNGSEVSSYTVNGDEKELKALLCRMWGCSVTPMSLRYILQDEGFLPLPMEEDTIKRIPAVITKRQPIKNVADKELATILTGKA